MRHVSRPLSKYGRTAKVHRMVRSRRKVIHIQPTKKERAEPRKKRSTEAREADESAESVDSYLPCLECRCSALPRRGARAAIGYRRLGSAVAKGRTAGTGESGGERRGGEGRGEGRVARA